MFYQSFWILTLSLFLVACGKKEDFIALPQAVYISPAKQLMFPTSIPLWHGITNVNLVEYALVLKEAVLLCNQDKQKILESVELQEKNLVFE